MMAPRYTTLKLMSAVGVEPMLKEAETEGQV